MNDQWSTFKQLDIAGAPSYILTGPPFHGGMGHGALMGQYCLTGETINRYPVFRLQPHLHPQCQRGRTLGGHLSLPRRSGQQSQANTKSPTIWWLDRH